MSYSQYQFLIGATLISCCTACQPSETELRRYAQLTEGLAASNKLQAERNIWEVDKMSREVERNQFQKQDIHLLKQMTEVRTRSAVLVGQLRRTRYRLQRLSGSQRWRREEPVAVLLNAGYADSLQRSLVAYARFAGGFREWSGAAPPTTPLQQLLAPGIRFGAYYFADASVPTALAELTLMESVVLRTEGQVMELLSRRMAGGHSFSLRYGAFASAESNMVGEGETYHAAMFLTVALRRDPMRLRMAVNGQPLRVTQHGIGRVVLTAPALPAGKKQALAIWNGTITARLDGRDSTFPFACPTPSCAAASLTRPAAAFSRRR